MSSRWLIVLNRNEAWVRQRFSLAHEFKHVLDHPYAETIYPDLPRASSHTRAEQACDYFAACLLMPRAWVKRAWGNRLQDPYRLARHFDVSKAAMQLRLVQTGLVEPTTRCPVAA